LALGNEPMFQIFRRIPKISIKWQKRRSMKLGQRVDVIGGSV
jgi:hypothetical protein